MKKFIILLIIALILGCSPRTKPEKFNCNKLTEEVTSILAMSSVCKYNKKKK